MNKDGSRQRKGQQPPLWLCAELTYRCPLQCPYCSNPTDLADFRKELTTEEWVDVLKQARAMGAAQLGFSGGEPLVRRDLTELIAEARQLGFYTNLITSSVGMDEDRLRDFKNAGLDHIQISFQASTQEVNDFMAGTDAFAHKVKMAKLFKKYDFPVVLNIVLHRYNLDSIEQILEMALALQADHVELANAQYYGFGYQNRSALMPTRQQLERAHQVTIQYQEKYRGKIDFFFVVPDYFETRPKPCMNGWGSLFLTIIPDGRALPCHSARVIPDIEFPNVKQSALDWIWYDSPAFNMFRGYDWMKEPCKTCPEKTRDFGGCRCQAYMLTGDARNADPVCDLSENHHLVLEAIEEAMHFQNAERFLVFRNPKNSRQIMRGDI